ncbi:hypothetical protein B0I35DRAFT_482786 [Stachybotrys elegans]|uniref:Uncharacterized protein n=1 Tax=Stachybotrys elegans TaxID=80388 RepID=A0A8K0SIJ0_9HYPO|nr:hypothetical protein B0I35DRAFT_482786 [Stachybotrys elegans]
MRRLIQRLAAASGIGAWPAQAPPSASPAPAQSAVAASTTDLTVQPGQQAPSLAPPAPPQSVFSSSATIEEEDRFYTPLGGSEAGDGDVVQETLPPAGNTIPSPLTEANLGLLDGDGDGDGDGVRKRKRSEEPPESPQAKLITRPSLRAAGVDPSDVRLDSVEFFTCDPPSNIAEVIERDNRERSSAPPSESDWREYTERMKQEYARPALGTELEDKFLKNYDEDVGYRHAFNASFTGFPEDPGFERSAKHPHPDYVQGLDVQRFGPFPAKERVKGAVLFENNPHSITLAHLSGEWNPNGIDLELARLQGTLNGAALVYARSQALAFMGKSDPLEYSGVTSFASDGTHIDLYAHYARRVKDGTLQYHQYPYASWDVKSSFSGFLKGRASLRNAQDRARALSYKLRNQLVEYWRQHHSGREDMSDTESMIVCVDTDRELTVEAADTDSSAMAQASEPAPAA